MLATNKSKKLIILTVVIIFLLFFLHYIKVLYPLERAIIYLTQPISQKAYQLSSFIGNNYLEFKAKGSLMRENKELKDQLLVLLKEKSEFYIEKEENMFLHQQLKFFPVLNYENLIAKVIGKSADNTQNALTLGVGSAQGVMVGQPVVAENGIMIGKIIKTNKNSSFALLLNDAQSRVAVEIQNQTRTFGLLEGEYGLGLRMKMIPQDEIFKEGDIVTTSGLEDLVPADIIIGQIEKIISSPEELFQEAAVRALIDFNKITIVNILIMKNGN